MSKRKTGLMSSEKKSGFAGRETALPADNGYGENNDKLDDLAKDAEDSAGEFLTTNQVLHAGWELRHRRQQHTSLLYSGCDQISRSDSRRQTGAAQRNTAGRFGP